MTRNEKKKLIENIRKTICNFYLSLITIPRKENYKKEYLAIGFDIDQARREMERISNDLNCDSTPDYKLTAYSTRTLEIFAELLDAQMSLRDIKGC